MITARDINAVEATDIIMTMTTSMVTVAAVAADIIIKRWL